MSLAGKGSFAVEGHNSSFALHEHDWIRAQRVGLMAWLNGYLAPDHHIDNVEVDLRDGVLLCIFLERMTGKELRFSRAPRNVHHRVLNHYTALQFMQNNIGMRMIGIGAEDMESGNAKLLLATLYALFRAVNRARRRCEPLVEGGIVLGRAPVEPLERDGDGDGYGDGNGDGDVTTTNDVSQRGDGADATVDNDAHAQADAPTTNVTPAASATETTKDGGEGDNSEAAAASTKSTPVVSDASSTVSTTTTTTKSDSTDTLGTSTSEKGKAEAKPSQTTPSATTTPTAAKKKKQKKKRIPKAQVEQADLMARMRTQVAVQQWDWVAAPTEDQNVEDSLCDGGVLAAVVHSMVSACALPSSSTSTSSTGTAQREAVGEGGPQETTATAADASSPTTASTDPIAVESMDAKGRLEHAFALAERELGVPSNIVQAGQVAAKTADKRTVRMYLTLLFDAFDRLQVERAEARRIAKEAEAEEAAKAEAEALAKAEAVDAEADMEAAGADGAADAASATDGAASSTPTQPVRASDAVLSGDSVSVEDDSDDVFTPPGPDAPAALKNKRVSVGEVVLDESPAQAAKAGGASAISDSSVQVVHLSPLSLDDDDGTGANPTELVLADTTPATGSTAPSAAKKAQKTKKKRGRGKNKRTVLDSDSGSDSESLEAQDDASVEVLPVMEERLEDAEAGEAPEVAGTGASVLGQVIRANSLPDGGLDSVKVVSVDKSFEDDEEAASSVQSMDDEEDDESTSSLSEDSRPPPPLTLPTAEVPAMEQYGLPVMWDSYVYLQTRGIRFPKGSVELQRTSLLTASLQVTRKRQAWTTAPFERLDAPESAWHREFLLGDDLSKERVEMKLEPYQSADRPRQVDMRPIGGHAWSMRKLEPLSTKAGWIKLKRYREVDEPWTAKLKLAVAWVRAQAGYMMFMDVRKRTIVVYNKWRSFSKFDPNLGTRRKANCFKVNGKAAFQYNTPVAKRELTILGPKGKVELATVVPDPESLRVEPVVMTVTVKPGQAGSAAPSPGALEPLYACGIGRGFVCTVSRTLALGAGEFMVTGDWRGRLTKRRTPTGSLRFTLYYTPPKVEVRNVDRIHALLPVVTIRDNIVAQAETRNERDFKIELVDPRQDAVLMLALLSAARMLPDLMKPMSRKKHSKRTRGSKMASVGDLVGL